VNVSLFALRCLLAELDLSVDDDGLPKRTNKAEVVALITAEFAALKYVRDAHHVPACMPACLPAVLLAVSYADNCRRACVCVCRVCLND
jgi:hypothetical protein